MTLLLKLSTFCQIPSISIFYSNPHYHHFHFHPDYCSCLLTDVPISAWNSYNPSFLEHMSESCQSSAENPLMASNYTWNTNPNAARPYMKWSLCTSLSSLYTAVTLLRIFQPQWPFSFSNMLSLFSPQSLCTGRFLCLEWSVPRFLHDWLLIHQGKNSQLSLLILYTDKN